MILSICSLISTGTSCRKPEIQLIPFEARKFIVQYLDNGNVEVKKDFLLAHWELLYKSMALKLENKILRKKLDEK